jgi:hypothetical protein
MWVEEQIEQGCGDEGVRGTERRLFERWEPRKKGKGTNKPQVIETE